MRLIARFSVTVAASLMLLSGCGGGESADDGAAAAADPEPAAQASTPTGTASITGAVNFSGEAPAGVPIRLDRECADLNSDTVMAQNVVVNDNGTLRHVFVYVKEGLGDYSFAPPAEPVVFDQSGCMYSPHVFGIQTGQPLNILNSDPLLHNIHALPEINRQFNFGMPRQGDEREREFRVPEVMVFIKCDVHPWMGAYAGVLDHPFYSVSGDNGGFNIGNLPAGDYVIEAWHEEYGTTTQNVSVGDGQTQEITFEFSAAATG